MSQNPVITQLDPGQVIKRVYDEANDRLRVDAEVTVNISSAQEVIISQTDDSIRIGDGINLVTTTSVLGDVGLDVNILGGAITGEFTQTGLKTQGKVTTMTVSHTPTPLPATPLTKRNSLAVTNLSSSDILYIGFSSSVTADATIGTNAGWEVGPNEGFNLDIQDDIIIYGITQSGITIKIKIMELA